DKGDGKAGGWRVRSTQGLPPNKQVRRGHHDEQPPVRIGEARFYYHSRAPPMHGRGLSSHRAMIGVAEEIRAQLDGKRELLGAAVEGTAGPVHAGQGSRGVSQGEQRSGVQHARELQQLGGERHLSHSTLTSDLQNLETYKFDKGPPDALLSLGNQRRR